MGDAEFPMHMIVIAVIVIVIIKAMIMAMGIYMYIYLHTHRRMHTCTITSHFHGGERNSEHRFLLQLCIIWAFMRVCVHVLLYMIGVCVYVTKNKSSRIRGYVCTLCLRLNVCNAVTGVLFMRMYMWVCRTKKLKGKVRPRTHNI